MKKRINKIISIGSNCISTDWANSIGIREKSPVDNFADFRLNSAVKLFNGELKRYVLNGEYIKKKSSLEARKEFFFLDEIFFFPEGFSIVHNNLESRKFHKNFKKRIRNIKKYCKKAQKDNSYWFLYSLSKLDETLSIEEINRLKNGLPKYCTDHLICLGIRGRNKNFEKIFNYYFELESEAQFKWHNKEQAFFIIKELEKKYDLNFCKENILK